MEPKPSLPQKSKDSFVIEFVSKRSLYAFISNRCLRITSRNYPNLVEIDTIAKIYSDLGDQERSDIIKNSLNLLDEEYYFFRTLNGDYFSIERQDRYPFAVAAFLINRAGLCLEDYITLLEEEYFL